MTQQAEYFLHRGLFTSQKPSILCGDQSISYSQLLSSVDACRLKLQEVDIRANDRVAIVSPNSSEYIILLLSLWSIKAIACPLSTRLPPEAVSGQLKQINARCIVTSENISLDLNNITIPRFHFSQIIDPSVTTSRQSLLESFYFDPNQKATILFTSASSSHPKAVLHTLDNHIASANSSNEYIPVVPDDQWLLSLPLYHVSGLSILFRMLLGSGTIVIAKTQEDIKTILKSYPITHASFVPTQFAKLLRNVNLSTQLKSLKAILIGGSSIPHSLLEQSSQLELSIYTTYGMTETASQIATAKHPLAAKILKDIKIKILSEGEIFVKGKTLFCGYVNGNNIHLPLNDHGWFQTGDMGTISNDGNLVVTGRKDDMFISGGENIHPEEIERFLCQMEEIEEAIVVPAHHKEFGYRPVGFVKTNGRASIKREELCSFLQKRLPKFKIPKRFYAWPGDLSIEGLKINRKSLIDALTKKSIVLTELH